MLKALFDAKRKREIDDALRQGKPIFKEKPTPKIRRSGFIFGSKRYDILDFDLKHMTDKAFSRTDVDAMIQRCRNAGMVADKNDEKQNRTPMKQKDENNAII